MGFDRYSIYPVKIGDILIRDVSNFDLKSASKKSSVIPGGSLHPSAIVNCCADPMITFGSRDMLGLFAGGASIGMQSGYAVNVNAGSPTPAALFQMQKRVDGGSYVGAGIGSHLVGTNGKGFLFLDGLVAQQDDEEGAKASLSYVLMSPDGLTSPVSWSATSALTSSPNFNGIWYLGPVRVGTYGSSTTQVEGIQRVEIKAGFTVKAPRADGGVFPVNCSINSIVPEITIRTLHPAGHSSFLGTPWGHAFAGGGGSGSFNVFLWKGVHGGGRIAANVAEHMLITASTGDNTTDDIAVNNIDDVTTDIIIRATGGLSILANQEIK